MPTDNAVVWWLMNVNPLYHLAESLRGLALGAGPVWPHVAALTLISLVAIAVLVPITARRLRRRVLGEDR
jgi:ABC-type polysaccharide/polyol phosphate export permease